jgi:hypothetical protein
MACPICRHTMQNLGASTDRIFWCPRCGCILTHSGDFENVSPTRLSRVVGFVLDGAKLGMDRFTYFVAKPLWDSLGAAIGREPPS